MFYKNAVLLMLLAFPLVAVPQAPQPPALPTATQPVQLRIPRWIALLRTVQALGPEPHRGRTSLPSGQRIDTCAGGGASSAAYCYDNTRLRGPDAALGAVTTDERLEFLRFFLLKYGLHSNPDFFTPGLTASDPNLVNGFAARARAALYGEMGVLQALINRVTGTAQLRGDLALMGNFQRQIKLLDYMFPDAAVWHMLLVETGHL